LSDAALHVACDHVFVTALERGRALNRKQILLVEDESLIVMMLEDILDELGYDAAGQAASVADALTLLDQNPAQFDAAIVDVNLGPDESWPVVARLIELDIPFLVSSGDSSGNRPDEYSAVLAIRKPYSFDQLKTAMDGLFADIASA